MWLLSYVFGKALADTAHDAKMLINEENQKQSVNRIQLDKSKIDVTSIKKYLSSINTEISSYEFKYDFSSGIDYLADIIEDSSITDNFIDRLNCIEFLKRYPNNIQKKCHLAEISLELSQSLSNLNIKWEALEDSTVSIDVTYYLLEECRYHLLQVLSQFIPNKKTIPTKYLLMAMDAEIYIRQGDYSNALRRYFQILEWDIMLDNAYQINNFDYNGTEDIYAAVVSNIINIFALISLPEKSEEIRKIFSKIISIERGMLYNNFGNSNESFKKYVQSCLNAYNASNKAIGFYLMSSTDSPAGLWSTFISSSSIDDPKYITSFFVYNDSYYTVDGFSYALLADPINNEKILDQRNIVLSMLENENI